MLAWIIQISLISLIFIFLVHNLIMFFKSTLTVPKIKDLVNSSEKKYQKIYDTLSSTPNLNSYTDIDLLPTSFIEESKKSDNSMKDELKSFLKKQLNNDNLSLENIGNNISNSLISQNNYANF